MRTRYQELNSYTTKDGSTIRELMHPDSQGNRQQSLAEATVPPGVKTVLHLHKQSEEIYYIVAGSGEMTLGENTFNVAVGDAVCIAPNTPHRIFNNNATDLKFLCACSPAYSHADTVLLEK